MRLDAVGIVCGDLERSIAFYRLLGVTLDDFDPETGHYEAELGGGIRLMLDSEAVMASFIDGFTKPKGNDRMSLAVECESAKDVDTAFRAATEAKFDAVRDPFDAFWGQRYATLADPDGTHVDLYAATSTEAL